METTECQIYFKKLGGNHGKNTRIKVITDGKTDDCSSFNIRVLNRYNINEGIKEQEICVMELVSADKLLGDVFTEE